MMSECLMQSQTDQEQYDSSEINYDSRDPHIPPPMGPPLQEVLLKNVALRQKDCSDVAHIVAPSH